MVFEGKLIYMGGAPERLEFWADPYEIFFGAIFARVGRQLACAGKLKVLCFRPFELGPDLGLLQKPMQLIKVSCDEPLAAET